MSSEPTSLELKNDLAELSRLVETIEAFGADHGLPPDAVMQLNVALEEIVTNIIEYGFDGGGHTIRIQFSMRGERLTVTVADDGRAFDPLARADPDVAAALEDRPIGGLGIHLVKTMMDDVEYARVDGHNVLTLIKHIAIKND